MPTIRRPTPFVQAHYDPARHKPLTPIRKHDLKITQIKTERLEKQHKKREVPSALSWKIKLAKERYAKRYSPTVTFLQCFEKFYSGIDWLASKGDIIGRISEAAEGILEEIEYAFTFISPIVRICTLTRLRGLYSDLVKDIERTQEQHPTLYATPISPESEEVKNANKIARENIHHLQLLALKKKKQLKKKLTALYVKAVPYFINTIVVSVGLVDKAIAKPVRKIFVTSVKETINIYRTISDINKQDEYTSGLTTDLVIDRTGRVVTPCSDENVSKFLEKLEQCKNTKAVKKQMKAARIDLIVPNRIEQFHYLLKTPRYRKLLEEKYHYGMRKNSCFSRAFQNRPSNQPIKKPYVHGEYVHNLLEERKADHKERLKNVIAEIKDEISKCAQLKSVEEIQEQFKALQIDLTTLEDYPLDSTEDWNEYKESPRFISKLAEIKLAQIEEEAYSMQLAVRQTLFVKHQLERPFLFYAIFESISNIALKIAQYAVSFLILYSVTEKLTNFIEIILKNVVKESYLSSVMPFFSFVSSLTSTIIDILLAVIKFTFSHYYKPNEYSFDGLYYELLLNGLKLSQSIYNAYSISRKVFVLLKTPFTSAEKTNDRYTKIEADKKKFEKSVKESIKAVKTAVHDLKLRDFDRALFPQTQGRGQKNDNINAIEVIQSTLAKGNIRHYPKETIEFLNRHLNLGIHELEYDALRQVSGDQLSSDIHGLYTADAEEFIERIRDNESAHILPSRELKNK